MNILPIQTGPYAEVCSIAWGEARQAILFDPGSDADVLRAELAERQLTVAAYACTHAHYDHIGALAELHDAAPAPILIHTLDLKWAFSEANQGAPHYPVPRRPNIAAFTPLESRAVWTFADLTFRVIHTPGHTPGGCCLYFKEADLLIAGDTLFRGSCGRTDLPGGDPRQLNDSLNKLKKLPDATRVIPGHQEETTIGFEKTHNFYMR